MALAYRGVTLCTYVRIYLLSIIPLLGLPEAWCGTCRQEAVERKPKHLIHVPHEVQTRHNLFLQLEGRREEKVRTGATRAQNEENNETREESRNSNQGGIRKVYFSMYLLRS